MFTRRKLILFSHKIAIRFNSHESKSTENLINKQLRFAAYQPKNCELNDKKLWESKEQSSDTSREHFSMIFPPPNVTGNLHLGHALTATIQDVIVRWKRNQNHKTNWIFGTDHAGIATQVVVEKMFAKEFGKTRHEIGREAFLKEVWKWKNERGNEISKDLQRMATSFNWKREYFTMDSSHSNVVNEAFIRLFEKNLIYRDVALINWSCALESAISDIEVENVEIQGKTSISVPNYQRNVIVGLLTEFAYKVVNSNEEIVVATTRPETMLGDTAVAVHPADPRYNHLKNVKLWHPYRNEEIPLIFDESVDQTFGTGAVKITPAHDRNDFEIGKRHNLKSIEVMTANGLIRQEFEQFANLPRFTAREKILNDLAEKQLLRGSKNHNLILPICSRSKDIVELMLKPQWFVNCKEMSSLAVEAVENGKIKIIPDTFEREWFRWLRNCRDWCISRQLWWGHQIPAYKIVSNEKEEVWMAGKSKEEVEQKFQVKYPQIKEFSIERDSDVLDTWFSSGLLPLTISGWPKEISEKEFPLSLMETGHDILFFWVARMVMLSLELTGKIPFKEILLHGIVCDAFGRKMSKSLGNVILPNQIINGATLADLQKEIENSVARGIIAKSELQKSLAGQRKLFPNGIQECGVDALRFTLCNQNVKQHFINFDINDCITNKLFFNKIWQATKYAINFAERKEINVREISNIDKTLLTDMDRWILSRLSNTLAVVNQALENYNFHFATSALKTFFYNNFCDVYLETTKEVLNTNEGKETAKVLNLCIVLGLQSMSIFTPHLADELMPFLPENISIDTSQFKDEGIELKVNEMLEICAKIREAKAHLKIAKKSKSEIKILSNSEELKMFLIKHLNRIQRLTFTENLSVITSSEFENENFDNIFTANHQCSFGVKHDNSEIKVNEEINKKKLIKLEKELTSMYKTVNNEGYREKANEKVQRKHFEKIEKLKMEIENLKQYAKN